MGYFLPGGRGGFEPLAQKMPATDDYRIGIFPLNVNKCDVTNMLLLHGAAEVSSNLRNALNDRSVENDAWM